jgi:pyrroloquinoline quinone biosynthesis protein B
MVKVICSIVLLIAGLYACDQEATIPSKKTITKQVIETPKGPSIIILGTVQDAGSPQIGCNKECCKNLFKSSDSHRMVSSLGLIDPERNKRYLIDATPDMTSQNSILNRYSASKGLPDGIFLTHAHIGHYTGMMYLGKEAINSSEVPVHAMPRLKKFLNDNGPWSQLVKNKNIKIIEIKNKDTLVLSKNLKIIPFLVPHRDEYSETVGYKIIGPAKSALFIPDIDKWSKWESNIIEEIASVDFAFIDGTFYDAEEINNRDISEIPHPFIIETMELLKNLKKQEKNKVYFIHLNHTNPALNEKSKAYQTIKSKGFNIAELQTVFALY